MTILASCKQTRFHLLDENPSSEVCGLQSAETITNLAEIDVEGLGIVVTAAAPEDDTKSKAKGKSKAKTAGRELIIDAHLRLKGEIHYGLLGRNGTGKSSKNTFASLGAIVDWGYYSFTQGDG